MVVIGVAAFFTTAILIDAGIHGVRKLHAAQLHSHKAAEAQAR